MDIQQATNHHRYLQFRGLLKRACSFPHLVFYNRKIINTYLLATHGFQFYINRDSQEEAKCEGCGNCIMLDPIVDHQAMEIKEELRRVLTEHESDCCFGKEANKQGRLLKLQNSILSELGSLLFQQLQQENLNYANLGKGLNLGVSLKELVGDRWEPVVKRLTKTKDRSIFLVSLFGLVFTTSDNLICQYCGEMSQSREINPAQCHRSCCLIKTTKAWESILSNQTVEELNKNEGEFLRTEGEVQARKIRDDLHNFSAESVSKLREFRYRIKQIKKTVQNLEDQKQSNKRNRKDCGALDRIYANAEEIEELIRSSIKKIKIW